MAVCYDGTILTSSDGIAWQERFSGVAGSLLAVTWSGSQFVAVGTCILTSPDGVNWTLRSSVSTYPWLNGVTWTGSRFLAAGSGAVYTSTDGATWSTQLIQNAGELYAVASNGTVNVAVGGFGQIYTNTTGATWTPQAAPAFSGIYGVVWDGQRFLAVNAAGQIMSSTDGTAWSFAQQNSSSSPLLGVVSRGQQAVAVGAYGRVFASANGTTWSQQGLPELTNELSCGVWTGTRFVVFSRSGSVFTSLDGLVWTATTQGTGLGVNVAATNGDMLVVANDGSGQVATSTDGANWTSRTVAMNQGIGGLAWCGTQFIAVGTQGGIFTSPEGVTWTARTSPTSSRLSGIAWSGNKAVAVGASVIIASTNGVDWSAQATTENLRAVTWGPSGFVAISTQGSVMHSEAGIEWTKATLPGAPLLLGVGAGGGIYFAVAGGQPGGPAPAGVFTSVDGLTWTQRPSTAGLALGSALFGGGRFVALGDRAIVTSGVGAPRFVTQPQSQTVPVGATVTLSVVLEGSPNATYQWRRDGVDLPGATEPTLTLANLSAGETARYAVRVSAYGLSALSDEALVVAELPWQAWRSEQFTASELADPSVSGPQADPDGDGWTNLVEFALGSDPWEASEPALAIARTEAEWTYTYERPLGRVVDYDVEFSIDLATWTTAGVTHQRLSQGETEVWRASVPAAGRGVVFFRLKVTQQ